MALSHATSQTPPPAPIEAFGPKISTPEPRLVIGRATSSSASAHGPSSFSMSADRSQRGSSEKPPPKPFRSCWRCSPASNPRCASFDNDTAFAQHARLKTMRAMTTWFCDAYASWQKGGVENANGRLRRWLPRQIDIDKVSDEDIQDIILTANLTPRKCLGFKTPFQAILKELGKDDTVFINPLHLAPESTNPLIAKACHLSLGSASLLASEGFLVVPALLRCLFEFFCDGRIHLR